MIETAGPGDFGRLLQSCRKSTGLTQIQLAELSTVSVRTIRDLESGSAKRPRKDTVRLLADGLRLGGRRRMHFELAAGRDPAAAAFDAACGAQPLAPPQPAGPLFGRERELAALSDIVLEGSDRLIEITGMAGVGKTRLALALAHQVHESARMAVLWLGHSGQAGPGPKLAGASGTDRDPLSDRIQQSLSRRDGNVDELATHIGGRALLLIINRDVPGSPNQQSTAALTTLLWNCPRLRILLTGRGERSPHAGKNFPLRPLPVEEPGADPAGQLQPASQLLWWHLRSVQPESELTPQSRSVIAELCWWLDGIPLALESAAAWSLILPLSDLAARAAADPLAFAGPPTTDRTPNVLQIGMANALSELPFAERSLLRRIVGFGNVSWSLAEAAGLTGRSAGELLPLVHGLLLRSLVRKTDPGPDRPARFRVLHSIRLLAGSACWPQVAAVPS